MEIENYQELYYNSALFFNQPCRYWLMFYQNFNIIDPEQKTNIDKIIHHYLNNKIVDVNLKFAIRINLSREEIHLLNKQFILYDIVQKTNILIMRKQYQNINIMLKFIINKLLISILDFEKILVIVNIPT